MNTTSTRDTDIEPTDSIHTILLKLLHLQYTLYQIKGCVVDPISRIYERYIIYISNVLPEHSIEVPRLNTQIPESSSYHVSRSSAIWRCKKLYIQIAIRATSSMCSHSLLVNIKLRLI